MATTAIVSKSLWYYKVVYKRHSNHIPWLLQYMTTRNDVYINMIPEFFSYTECHHVISDR